MDVDEPSEQQSQTNHTPSQSDSHTTAAATPRKQLPQDVLLMIAGHLSLLDRCSLGCTSRYHSRALTTGGAFKLKPEDIAFARDIFRAMTPGRNLSVAHMRRLPQQRVGQFAQITLQSNQNPGELRLYADDAGNAWFLNKSLVCDPRSALQFKFDGKNGHWHLYTADGGTISDGRAMCCFANDSLVHHLWWIGLLEEAMVYLQVHDVVTSWYDTMALKTIIPEVLKCRKHRLLKTMIRRRHKAANTNTTIL